MIPLMQKPKKLTEEQASRVLSHAEELIRYGASRQVKRAWKAGCINQVAYNIGDVSKAWHANAALAYEFDDLPKGFDPYSPEEILSFLEYVKAI